MYSHQTLALIEEAAGPVYQADHLPLGERIEKMRLILAEVHGQFVQTQFADTVTTMLADLRRANANWTEVRFEDLPGFLARAQDWLNCELVKRKRLTVYKVETPLGAVNVMAKSFMGARFAAGEKLFQEAARESAPHLVRGFAAQIDRLPVSLCVHAFHYISEAEATRREKQLPALESSLSGCVDVFMMRHWIGLTR